MTTPPACVRPTAPLTRLARAGVLSCAGLLLGCQAPQRPGDPPLGRLAAPPSAAGVAAAAGAMDRPVAVVAGEPVRWSDLWPWLAESAGGVALEEAALDLLLTRELAAAGITISAADLAAEEALLLETASADARVTRDEAARALEDLKTSRGLGPTRAAALVRRNASLRALVRSSVIVDDSLLAQARDAEFGDKVRARLIVRPDDRSAAQLRAELGAAPEPEGVDRAARARSIHPTAAAGGQLDPFSPRDPAVPASVRLAAQQTPPGQLSPVIPLDQGFALLYVEAAIPGRVPSQAEEDALRARVRARRERLAMDQAAAELLARANVTVLDPALRWGYSRRPR